jgi:exodeoxyribonuclease III
MKIIAWNVNGIRSLLKKKDLDELIQTNDPDIFCMGETKISSLDTKKEFDERFKQYKYHYWSKSEEKDGYSGTAIMSKKKPLSCKYGLHYKNKNIDTEGRVICLEYKHYYLVHVYTPNSGHALQRLKWRVEEWDVAFSEYISELSLKKNIIVCGDLNVAKEDIDLKNPKTNHRTAGFTDEERKSFNNLLNNCNLIDTFRNLYPNKIEYSFWSYMRKSREKNVGWRIDYFLVNKEYHNKIKDSKILTNVYGSDHAPVLLEL